MYSYEDPAIFEQLHKQPRELGTLILKYFDKTLGFDARTAIGKISLKSVIVIQREPHWLLKQRVFSACGWHI